MGCSLKPSNFKHREILINQEGGGYNPVTSPKQQILPKSNQPISGVPFPFPCIMWVSSIILCLLLYYVYVRQVGGWLRNYEQTLVSSLGRENRWLDNSWLGSVSLLERIAQDTSLRLGGRGQKTAHFSHGTPRRPERVAGPRNNSSLCHSLVPWRQIINVQ